MPPAASINTGRRSSAGSAMLPAVAHQVQAAGPAQLCRACLAGAGPVDDVSQGSEGTILCKGAGQDRKGRGHVEVTL
jgi:hypothetical protein